MVLIVMINSSRNNVINLLRFHSLPVCNNYFTVRFSPVLMLNWIPMPATVWRKSMVY